MSARTEAFLKMFSTTGLKEMGTCPRPGEVPFKTRGFSGLGRRRGYLKRWRLDQAVLIKPRGCSPTIASAIDQYNATPTVANLDQVRMLIAMM